MVKTKSKAAGRRGDDGQANNQRAIKNLEQRVDRIQKRTVTPPKAAASVNRFANEVRTARALKNVPLSSAGLPRHILTTEELEHHAYHRGLSDDGHELVNENIEPSIVTQKWTGMYEFDVTNLATSQAMQFSVMGTTNTRVGDTDTPKSFGSYNITNIGAAGTQAVCGPCAAGASASCAVVKGLVGVGQVALDTTAFAAGWADAAVNSNPACPFTGVDNEGSSLRWQLCRIKIKVENVTKGSDRGGIATLIQPTNASDDLLALAAPADFMGRGIYRAYNDGEVCSKNPDGYVSLDVRTGLKAFHHKIAGGPVSNLHDAALHLVIENNSGATNSYRVYLKLDWLLAGNQVRGIGIPHVPSPEAADRARQVSETNRAAGIIPSDQRGKEHVAAGMELVTNKALQNSLHPPSHPESEGAIQKAASTLLGKHAKSLAAAGFTAAASALGM